MDAQLPKKETTKAANIKKNGERIMNKNLTRSPTTCNLAQHQIFCSKISTGLNFAVRK
jgi:hypothetical protein